MKFNRRLDEIDKKEKGAESRATWRLTGDGGILTHIFFWPWRVAMEKNGENYLNS